MIKQFVRSMLMTREERQLPMLSKGSCQPKIFLSRRQNPQRISHAGSHHGEHFHGEFHVSAEND